jgi:hypothetical protein
MPLAKKEARRGVRGKGLQGMRERKLEGLRETEFLLSSPKNAERLRSALAQAKAGKLVEHELDECSDQARQA